MRDRTCWPVELPHPSPLYKTDPSGRPNHLTSTHIVVDKPLGEALTGNWNRGPAGHVPGPGAVSIQKNFGGPLRVEALAACTGGAVQLKPPEWQGRS
jgi:hypothetical protein